MTTFALLPGLPGLVGFLGLLAAGGLREGAPEPPPNVVLVLTDDQGYADLGVQGIVDDVRTPHLDALAAGGVRFTQGYVTAPQCTPSRAGLLTGRYQQRFGLDENQARALPLDQPTLAERLHAKGYVSCMVGKWQLNHEGREAAGPEFLPGARGFDEFFVGFRKDYRVSPGMHPDGDEGAGSRRPPPFLLGDEGYRVHTQTEAAVRFVERNRERAFFLYLSYSAPHAPLEAPPELLERFADVLDEERRLSLAMTAAIDDGVGRLVETLRRHGLEERTLVLFLSDNGAPLRGAAANGSSNAPFRGGKGDLLEGGIRIPFLASWKGRLPAGTVFDRPVSALDVVPTVLAAAGLSWDADLDGVDLLPWLLGEREGEPHEALFWSFRGRSAVRRGRWKLLLEGDAPVGLFDLAEDPAEQRDRRAEQPERARELESELRAWAKSVEPRSGR